MRALLIYFVYALNSIGYASADELIDLTFFRPPPTASRKIDTPIVRWWIKSNPETFCANATGKDGLATTPGGCAYWQREKSSCTVVTASSTTHSVLGHLLITCLMASQKS